MSSELEVKRAVWDEIDPATRARVGELSAYGLIETQIADSLLISVDQVINIQESPEFKTARARVLKERLERKIDAEDGWDAVEERALENVLKTLEYNRDPNYALMAARIANQAKRRVTSDDRPVIDAGRAGNVVMITVNKTYMQNTQNNQINLQRGAASEIEHKRTDLLGPKGIQKMLKAEDDEGGVIIDKNLGILELVDTINVGTEK